VQWRKIRDRIPRERRRSVVKSFADIEFFKPKLAKQDLLSSELSHFFECIREGKAPLVSVQHGRDAPELAGEVLRNIKVHD
jgi:hypothetical protein